MFYRISPLVVRSPRSLRRPSPDEREVVLAARYGFPPGHPSTRGSIDLMVKAGIKGATVLDLGCGTGVLGLCALALGARLAVGCDILNTPIDAAKKNIGANPELRQFLLFKGSSEALSCRFDTILANLPRDVQDGKLTEYPRLLRPGGRLIMSGFSDADLVPLAAGIARLGFFIEERTFLEDSALAIAGGGSSTWAALSALLKRV
jgi:ribosomal protein L11 methyltransferase